MLAPPFVERHPHHDGGVVAQRVHDAPQLVGEFLLRRCCLVVAARHVLPHQHAQPVAVVVPARRFHLDVLADQVEAQVLQRLDVRAPCLVGRSRVEPVGPPPLIEGAELEQRPVIEGEPRHAGAVPGHRDLAHPEVARDRVFPRRGEAHTQAIQEGMARAPQLRVVDGERKWPPDQAGPLGNPPVAVERGDADAGCRRRTGGVHPDRHRAGVHVGSHVERRDVVARHRFEPHRLPDAGDRGVPDALGLGDLFAARLLPVVGRVPDAHHELLVAAAMQLFGHVDGERIVAAPVGGDRAAVHEDRGFPVHRAEVQQPADSPRRARQAEGVAVPEALLVGHRALHAGELRLDRERHQDLAVEATRPRCSAVPHRVFPQSIQVHPSGSRHLGPRVFGQGVEVGGVDGGRPAGPEARGRRGDYGRLLSCQGQDGAGGEQHGA